MTSNIANVKFFIKYEITEERCDYNKLIFIFHKEFKYFN